jgi:hypothetical protein
MTLACFTADGETFLCVLASRVKFIFFAFCLYEGRVCVCSLLCGLAPFIYA